MAELTKEEEIEIAKVMEEKSILILLYLRDIGKLQYYLKDVISSIEDGTYDISYVSATRYRIGKDGVIQNLQKVLKNPSDKRLRNIRLNYIISFRMGERLITAESGKHKKLEAIITQYLKCRDKLIDANMGVITYVANFMEKNRVSWTTSYEEHDIEMEAYMAMIQAAGRYDYRVGCRFFSYATWVVYNAVYNFIREEASPIHYPVSHHKRRNSIISNTDSLEQRTGRKVSLGELEDELGLEPGALEGKEAQSEFLSRVRVIMSNEDEDQQFWEYIVDKSEEDNNFINTFKSIILKRSRGILTDEEIDLMCHDFQLSMDKTEKEIREDYKITSMKKVRELMKDKLRKS